MDVDEFLALPLVARVAVNGPNGPTVRPVWYLYEDGIFWWLTGAYSRLGDWLKADPRASVVVDTCDLATGEVWAVTATGHAIVRPFDPELATRKLTKYLGPDASTASRPGSPAPAGGPRVDRWPDRFRQVFDDPTSNLISLRPTRPLRLRDLSYA
ncbi:MAG: pyridoxamine 5'-phosphate oxidase family protein [Egibacteraceae bacterium]